MGRHYDADGDGVADQGELDIGALEDETIFVPEPEHQASGEQELMSMGREPENDLRDPWFHTEAGQAWLAEHDDAAATREAGEG